MKRKRGRFQKFNLIYFIPLIIVLIIVSISTVFANLLSKDPLTEAVSGLPKMGESETKSSDQEVKKIKVYFHQTDEVKEMNLEEYLLGVLPAEMPPSFEMEALKAQAIAARTFAVNRQRAENEESLKQHKGGEVCTDPNHCKAYIGEEKLIEKWGNDWQGKYKGKIAQAVGDTKNMIVTYEGEPISAVFHSTSSGKTENSEDVWQSALPYLRSVPSEGEEASPRYQSQEEFSLEDFKNKILGHSPNATFSEKPQNWVGKIEHTESGSVKSIEIGGVSLKGTEIRSIFSLRSANFSLTLTDKARFQVTGNGHGVGMSQYGANYAASQGSNYKQILQKYYQGVEIETL